MLTTGASALRVILILLSTGTHLGELRIRRRAQVRIEWVRHLAAQDTIMAMRSGSLAVVQLPEGTTSVLMRTPVADGGAAAARSL